MTDSSKLPKLSLTTRSLYLQIRDHFVQLIASGEWVSDSAIESEIDLALSLGVSTGTVRKALDALESEGLVIRKQGRGTFVTDQSSEAHTSRFSNLRIGEGHRVTGLVDTHECRLEPASNDEMRKLKLREGDQVFRCKRTRQHHSRRFMYETLAISERLMPMLSTDDFAVPSVAVLGAKRHNMLIGRAEECVDIALADEVVATALGVAIGKPLLRLDRILYSHTGTPIEWRVAQCDLHDKYYKADLS